MKKITLISLIVIALFSACHNQDWEFPDYKYTTVYFPYQSPVRTLVLGKDIYDNSLDNAHKCKIMATMGGVYENKTDRILDVVLDNALCDNLKFDSDSGEQVLPMPASYYQLDQSMQIVIPKGEIAGGIEVQLTDAFFADPLSIKNTYVIPLRITSVANADSVLSGSASVSDPDLRVAEDWAIAPKNYVLYCVKYVNSWHGAYLRRGVDVGTGDSGYAMYDTTAVYHNQYVERDQVVKMYTKSMDEVSLSLTTRAKGDPTDIPFSILIKMDDSGKCTVTKPENASYTVSGSGEFVADGDEWGGEPKDVMYLNYTVDFDSIQHVFTDTLVMRDRQVAFETFEPVVVE